MLAVLHVANLCNAYSVIWCKFMYWYVCTVAYLSCMQHRQFIIRFRNLICHNYLLWLL